MATPTIIYQGGSHCCGDCKAWCRGVKWVITDTYIERQVGVCCVEVDNLQLVRIKDISYRSGACCCGECGEIKIISSDVSDPEMALTGIPDGKNVYSRIRDAWDKQTMGAKVNIQQ